jgi:hypothetical protein
LGGLGGGEEARRRSLLICEALTLARIANVVVLENILLNLVASTKVVVVTIVHS